MIAQSSVYLPSNAFVTVASNMIVGHKNCPTCGREVNIINLRGKEGLRAFDEFARHETDHHGGVRCSMSGKFAKQI